MAANVFGNCSGCKNKYAKVAVTGIQLNIYFISVCFAIFERVASVV
jgi:hypothetical protein